MIKKHLLNMTPFQMNKSRGSIYISQGSMYFNNIIIKEKFLLGI